MGETNNADIKIIKRILNFYPILRYLDDSDSSEAYSSSPITSHTIWTTSLLEFMLGSPSHMSYRLTQYFQHSTDYQRVTPCTTLDSLRWKSSTSIWSSLGSSMLSTE